MSDFVFNCPFCDQPIAADDSLCGEPDICPNCENNISIPIPGLEPGVQFGDFELLDLLGAGATGEVWKARQLSMNRIVALKVLLPNLTTNKNFIERFKQEAHHSAKLSHPMIVTAYYYGQDKGIHYLAITYVDGQTIASVLKNGEMYPEADALWIIRGISTALAYAWNDFKIIHRDIKPENIMIDSKGNPMLLDLGIAKSTNEDTGLTMTGMVIGTPYYMSPEQAKGFKDIDFKADIYSLGATLYHMVVGKVPYSADSTMAIMLKHLNDELPPPREINPSISVNTEKIIKKMMAKDRNDRYQSWEDLIEDIDRVLRKKKVIHAKKAPKSSKSSFKSFVILFIFTLIAAGIAGGIFYVKKMKKTRRQFRKASIVQTEKEKVTTKLGTNNENKASTAKDKTTDISDKKVLEADLKKETKKKSTIKTVKKTENKSTPQKTEKKITSKKTTQKIKLHKDKKKNEVVKPKKKTKPMIKIVEDENKKDNTLIEADDIQLDNNPKLFTVVAEKLDVKKHSINEVENYWDSIVGTRFKWAGKITYYRSLGTNEFEVRVAIPGAKVFDDHNIILHLKSNKETPKLGKNRTIFFEGEVYKKQLIKGTGAVIVHMKKIKKLSIY